MRAPRTHSICVSFLLFGIAGLVMHEVMSSNLCAHQMRVGLVTILALLLLIVSLTFAKVDKSDGRSVRRVISYLLVIVISAGVWYEIWSIQACSEGTRSNMVHQSQ